MKFGHLVEYYMRNIFLEKPYIKCGEKLVLDLFLKIEIEHISGSTLWSFTQFVFIVCQVKDYRNILKLRCRALAFISYKTFSKTKRGLELISLSHFLHDFWRKIFLTWRPATLFKKRLQRKWCGSHVFIVNFEHISHFFLLFLPVFLLLISNK